ncbi:MAG: hypothetical protein K0M39_14750 [Rhizobium sp.]|nr:hypothetical protein [Rhizobium sp.]
MHALPDAFVPFCIAESGDIAHDTLVYQGVIRQLGKWGGDRAAGAGDTRFRFLPTSVLGFNHLNTSE